MTTDPRELRNEFVHWLSITPWDYFVTLNLNRPTTYPVARKHFKNFCQRVDRKLVGPRYWKQSDERALIIALPEHIDSNLHLHCLMMCRGKHHVSRRQATNLILPSWKEVILSGTAQVQDIPEKYTLAQYVTKELSRKGQYEKVILSSEFWK